MLRRVLLSITRRKRLGRRPATDRVGGVQATTDRPSDHIALSPFDDVAVPHAVIRRCESRLAMSASLGVDTLLADWAIQPTCQAADFPHSSPINAAQAWHAGDLDPITPATNASLSMASTAAAATPDLFAQADQIRRQFGIDGSGQTVAVIDSGTAWDHVAFGAGNPQGGFASGGFGNGNRVVGGWDFAENDANPYDDAPAGYHGTHVSGILAGQTQQFTGIAPGADIVSLRVFDDAGRGQLQWIESALRWVHDNRNAFDSPITTINLSIGAALDDSNRDAATSLLADELQMLRGEGILVFAAAGNFYGNSQYPSAATELLFPASSEDVIAVSSLADGGWLSSFSQRQNDVLAAVGEQVVSSVPDHVFGWDGKVDDVTSLSGTSQATPQIAGASMLIRQALIEAGIDPTEQAILERLKSTSTTGLDAGSGVSYHRVDVWAAVSGIVATGNAQSPLTPSTPLIDAIDHYVADDASESFVLDLRDGVTLKVGDRTFDLRSHDAQQPIVIDGGGGADALRILGSTGSERLRLSPPASTDADQSSRLISNGIEYTLRGFEQVTMEGGGGNDRATLFDSPTDDTLESRPNHATLSGVGFRFEVTDTPLIYVHARSGGNDVAYLHDGSGDDVLAVVPQYTSLQGDAAFQAAYGFERVFAYADAGGNDSVSIQDSAGDDSINISRSRTLVSGPDYQVSTRGFESVAAQAGGGGQDVVRFYAEGDDNHWYVTPDLTQWTDAAGVTRTARGFTQTIAFVDQVAFDPASLVRVSTASTHWIEASASRDWFARFGSDAVT